MTDCERQWCEAASRRGGSFVRTFAMACYAADDDNFAILRPILAKMMAKYPGYLTPECVAIENSFRCNQLADCCPLPGCSVPHTLTDTCLKHMDERNGQRMCQECCYAFDNPGVPQ